MQSTSAAMPPDDHLNNSSMANPKHRMSSFSDWPLTLPMPEQLVECGLYYTKHNGITMCFSCGVSIREWKPWEDPWKKHREYSPACRFLAHPTSPPDGTASSSAHGPAAGHMTLEDEARGIFLEYHVAKAAKRNAGKNLTSSEYLDDILQDYKRTKCEESLKEQLRSQESFLKLNHQRQEDNEKQRQQKEEADLKERHQKEIAVLKDRHRIDEADFKKHKEKELDALKTIFQNLKSEHDKNVVKADILDILICNVCLNAKKQIVFQPCGHFSACTPCASRLLDCPVCRKRISHRIKAFVV